MARLRFGFFLAVAATLALLCTPTPSHSAGVVQTLSSLKSTYALTIILQAVDPGGIFASADFVKRLNSNSTRKTLFAPLDDAFNKVFASGLSLLSLSPYLEEFGSYHSSPIVLSKSYIDQQPGAFYLPTFLAAGGVTNSSLITPQVIRVAQTNGTLTFQIAGWWESVVIASYPADDGMLYVMSETLPPPVTLKETLGLKKMVLMPLVPSAKNLTTNYVSKFTDFAVATNFTDELEAVVPGTILLPSNTGFDAAKAVIDDATTDEAVRTKLMLDVLRYNTLTGIFYTAEKPGLYPTLLNETLSLNASTSPTFFGSTPIVRTVLLSNGVAHLVDSLAFPSSVNTMLYALNNTPDRLAQKSGGYLIIGVASALCILGVLIAFAGWGQGKWKSWAEERRSECSCRLSVRRGVVPPCVLCFFSAHARPYRQAPPLFQSLRHQSWRPQGKQPRVRRTAVSRGAQIRAPGIGRNRVVPGSARSHQHDFQRWMVHCPLDRHERSGSRASRLPPPL
ncbi:hypothetical protein M427DRAFT_260619 [Gonapodya prolifera JEL478]|uniref:FAS1 domain-containing protein n=1 Tax=Gonapodya prolifera (strain JEL478) TaxID=1344416 RepID=A0A139AKV8_GONPJ|nr:hypothetical protein M427DRAFT_260619 [Gonapodya prolifera JEL478]|eukprot:KXS17406.1 hypothetical protein M427DRAFT_260619 [Gonapodya prolifera JEL478]